ncbi:hypothetical protein DL98DRAFT_597928 [Cadophora sp. DSE1049]|nr:hypothetical protein DL98DRAFT_597928 [Cadophora sp. DSE1049]
MCSSRFKLCLSFVLLQAAGIAASLLSVQKITRIDNIKFENLAIRPNGQILTTTTKPNASVYQIDPLGILPPTLIHFIPNVKSATGIAEGRPDVFYVASGSFEIQEPAQTHPESYSITEIDTRGVSLYPNGSLTRQPVIKHVANLPGASLPNGVVFARPGSENLLVADSFRGLIWNVNVYTGDVGVALNDSTTKGVQEKGPAFTGVNGVKVYNDTLYWTNTGLNSLYKVPLDRCGNVPTGQVPVQLASNMSCDDFAVGRQGNIYVASPQDVLFRIGSSGQREIIAGRLVSNSSALVGPSAVRFGRLVSDRWSLYISTNGGVYAPVSGSTGISRVDLE